MDYNLCFKLIYNFFSSDLFNNIVLTVTLFYLYRYTKETQQMKNEMIEQRKMADAIDVEITLSPNSAYDITTEKEMSFANIKAETAKNNICEFSLRQRPQGVYL